MMLARRIFAENRVVVIALLAALVLNILAYVLIVRPLGEIATS